MQNNVYQGINTQNPQENVIAGAVGAFLFSLAGGCGLVPALADRHPCRNKRRYRSGLRNKRL